MNDNSVGEERCWSAEEALRPYRHLARRVLALALLDAANPGGSTADRESAREFLNGSRMLVHWCRVAALEPSCVVTAAEKLGAGRASAL